MMTLKCKDLIMKECLIIKCNLFQNVRFEKLKLNLYLNRDQVSNGGIAQK